MAGKVNYTLTGQPVIFGGTRSAVTERMVNRAWQPPKPERMKNCPFCYEKGQLADKLARGEVLARYPEDRPLGEHRFAVLKNIATPHPVHELIVPAHDEPIWPWGEVSFLAELLEVIGRQQKESIFLSPGVVHSQIGFHYGYMAGQNFNHPHIHVIGSDWPLPSGDCPWCGWESKREFIFKETDSLLAFLDGTRAGETVICARQHGRNSLLERPGEVAGILMDIASLFKERFNDPDFILTTALVKGGHFWLQYTPVLNIWGCTEMLAIRGLYCFTQSLCSRGDAPISPGGKGVFPGGGESSPFPRKISMRDCQRPEIILGVLF